MRSSGGPDYSRIFTVRYSRSTLTIKVIRLKISDAMDDMAQTAHMVPKSLNKGDRTLWPQR